MIALAPPLQAKELPLWGLSQPLQKGPSMVYSSPPFFCFFCSVLEEKEIEDKASVMEVTGLFSSEI